MKLAVVGDENRSESKATVRVFLEEEKINKKSKLFVAQGYTVVRLFIGEF